MRRPAIASLLLSVALAACAPVATTDDLDDELALEGKSDGADDIVARLRKQDGLVEISSSGAYISLRIAQPIDHSHPERGEFLQRVSITHRGRRAPLVLETEGYSMSGGGELPGLLDANAVHIEHRGFGESIYAQPGADVEALTIEQAAGDLHRVVVALRRIYRGRFLSTGASKGGMTAVYFRRFYPDDVDGTVAYVAPHSHGPSDQRYAAFFDTVGDPACRARVAAVQRAMLAPAERARLVELVRERGGFDRLGPEIALEHAVVSLPWMLFSYSPVDSCDRLPDPQGASSEVLLSVLSSLGTLGRQSDEEVDYFRPYFVQALRQLGFPAPPTREIADLITVDTTTETARKAALLGDPRAVHDPAAMRDVADWLTTEGERVLFIYGGNDPWTAGAFPLGARDSYRLIVPGSNHGAMITELEGDDRALAERKLKEWANVPALHDIVIDPAARRRELLRRIGQAAAR